MQNNFTWQPTMPKTPGFHNEPGLKDTLTTLRNKYREDIKQAIVDHCNSGLEANKALLVEMEAENPPTVAETVNTQDTIMARMAEMVQGIYKQIPTVVETVLKAREAEREAELENDLASVIQNTDQ